MPIYENDETKSAQQRVADMCAAEWGCEIVELPRSYVLDYALVFDGHIHAYLEIKCRDTKANAFPNYFVGMHKALKAREFLQFKVPSFLVVQWNDAAGWIDLNSKLHSMQVFGRTDRGDPNDIEPCAFYPVKNFSRIDQSPIEKTYRLTKTGAPLDVLI